MDINARINWQPGMEISSELLRGWYHDVDQQQQIAIRAALGSVRVGLLPGAEFNNQGMFVRNTFEMPRFRCRALLSSGQILDIDEPVRMVIPMLYGTVYYLTVSMGSGVRTFEREGAPYVCPNYEYGIHTLEEISDDMLPVVRFKASEGMLNYDPDFIPPTLQLTGDERFKDYIARYIEQLETISNHPNMDPDLGRQTITRYILYLRCFNLKNNTSDFVMLTEELVQALDFIVMSAVDESHRVEIQQPDFNDIQQWLEWVSDYFRTSLSLLDFVERKDDTIDIEALKAQIIAELYDKLYRELHDKLLVEIKEQLTEELAENLQNILVEYINNTMRPALAEQLHDQLSASLYDKLYQDLYDALFAALNIPRVVEEEDTFMPLI